MKNLFFLLAATLMLASCKKDMTCTCTFDDLAGVAVPDVVTTCTGCNGDEQDAFEASCTAADAAATDADGNSIGSCVLD